MLPANQLLMETNWYAKTAYMQGWHQKSKNRVEPNRELESDEQTLSFASGKTKIAAFATTIYST